MYLEGSTPVNIDWMQSMGSILNLRCEENFFFLLFVFHMCFSLTKVLQVAHLKILNKAFCQGSCL